MRPKIDHESKRGKSVNVRLTNIEYECIQESARRAGMSLSEYCRTQTLKGKVGIYYPIVADMKELREVARQLAPIGNNLNQIAQYFHTGGSRSEFVLQELNKAVRDIHSIKDWIDKQAGDQIGDRKTLGI